MEKYYAACLGVEICFWIVKIVKIDSIPGSEQDIISHVYSTYDYSGPFRVPWVHIYGLKKYVL